MAHKFNFFENNLRMKAKITFKRVCATKLGQGLIKIYEILHFLSVLILVVCLSLFQ